MDLNRMAVDFIIIDDYIIFKNKKALNVIQESLDLSLEDLIKIIKSNNEDEFIDKSELALLEKLRRKLNISKITDELNQLFNSILETDQVRLVQILNSFYNSKLDKLLSKDVINSASKNLFDRISLLAESTNEAEQIKYIKTVGPIIQILDSIGVYSLNHFLGFLVKVVKTPSISIKLKQQAMFELILCSQNFNSTLKTIRGLNKKDRITILTDLKDWKKSIDLRKQNYIILLNNKWSEYIANGEVAKIEDLVSLNLFDVNSKNISEVSILQLAAYYNQQIIIDWLIANHTFDFNAKNSLGFTEIEQLQLIGKTSLVNQIRKLRPELIIRNIVIKERNDKLKSSEYPYGQPYIDFVRIEPNSFLMGPQTKKDQSFLHLLFTNNLKEDKVKVLTTITEAFEIMSVDTTQQVYRTVSELLKVKFHNKFNKLNSSPSYFNGELNPVENICYEDLTLWIEGLNELSKLADINVQQSLIYLFPNHKFGDKYALPTEAQWELVSRLGGVAEGNYSHGNTRRNLSDYAVYYENSKKTQPVGSKKPVFYNGKPIYDLYGNVWKWIADWYGKTLTGGINPLGSSIISKRVLRGGSWFSKSDENDLQTSYRYSRSPFEAGYNDIGFRLIRTSIESSFIYF
jgi:formylglycine-generating enzyme required for sulfatase activity